jgi:hypothetical protein
MKAITFLGATTAYETTYVLDDGREHTAPFFGVALARFVPDLKMRVFVTKLAREKHLAHLETLVEDYVADVEPIDIPDGGNDEELWTIFQKVVDAVEPEEAVIFDITHGYRSLPFLSFLSAAYLRTVKRVRMEAVYYGNFEARDTKVTPNRAPVIDLTRFVELFDWMIGADRFVRFGDARDLAQLLTAQHERIKPNSQTASQAEMAAWNQSPIKHVANNLNKVSRSLRVLRPVEAMNASHVVTTQLPEAVRSVEQLALPFAPLSEHVVESFAPISLERTAQNDPQFMLETEHRLIGWYLQRNQTFQAVALAREWLVSWIMVQVGMADRLMEKDAREIAERTIGRQVQRLRNKTVQVQDDALLGLSNFPNIGDVAQLFNELGDLRNDLMHAGKRKNALTAEAVEDKVQKLWHKLQALVDEDTTPGSGIYGDDES